MTSFRVGLRLGAWLLVTAGASPTAGPLPPQAGQGPASSATGARLERDGPSPSCGAFGSVDGLPAGFVAEPILGPWDQALGFTFDAIGRLYVWEKKGVVWLVEGGVKQEQPFLDLREEVGDWESHGLKGLALHPDFLENGFVYAFYAVDRHHLDHYGSPSYDPSADEYHTNTIGRLTRFTARWQDFFRSVDPASRFVLLGETRADGLAICGPHGCGDVVFLHDGTLALSTGDSEADGHGNLSCVSEGILDIKEHIQGLRAQLVDSLNGKVLRIDPETGAGLPDNPFFDADEPFAPRSRVWALGLRNPFRMSLRPRRGARRHPHFPAEVHAGRAGPGTLFVSDVGSAYFEELNQVRGGENLGWPFYEGLQSHVPTPTPNLDAPNPLFVPGAGGPCEPFFRFRQLLVEDALVPPTWPNPCDSSQSVPASIPRHRHTRPGLTWGHHVGPAATPAYDGFGTPVWVEVGDPSGGVEGESFAGNSSIAGTWYDGESFPPRYRGAYFHADYGGQWIRALWFDADDRLLAVEPFGSTIGPVVGLEVDPVTGDLCFLEFGFSTGYTLKRIVHASHDLSPVPSLEASREAGGPLVQVRFDASGTIDPEGGPLTYRWDFGDGSPPSNEVRPRHVFPQRDVTASGTIVTGLDHLDPPLPMGQGSPDPEVMRDGLWPIVNANYVLGQFDTFHVDATTLLPDKGTWDGFGYVFGEPQLFTELVFQEGIRWEPDTGGWFSGRPRVQVLNGQGTWRTLEQVEFAPEYAGLYAPEGSYDFGTYRVRFAPTVGRGIRLWGRPGGEFDFVSCGELRVFAWDPTVVGPRNYDVSLRVTDDHGNESCETFTVSVNNSAPRVSLVSPVDGAPLDLSSGPVLLPYAAEVSDAEHATGSLRCTWRTRLIHDNHDHPEPPVISCSAQGVFLEHASDPGDVLYYEVLLTVTDPLGLSTTETAHLFLGDDCNFNGVDDLQDIAQGVLHDANANGFPDECESDCNGNGRHDVFDLVLGTSPDRDQDGVPDECQSEAPRPGTPRPGR